MCLNVLIALGSNVTSLSTSPDQLLNESMDEISKRIGKIFLRSKTYRTPCFPAGAGPDFANAVIRVETDLDIRGVLDALHAIEADFGRVRTVRWGQRTLDLDLLAADDVVSPDEMTVRGWIDLPLDRQMAESPDQLLLPHPRLRQLFRRSAHPRRSLRPHRRMGKQPLLAPPLRALFQYG